VLPPSDVGISKITHVSNYYIIICKSKEYFWTCSAQRLFVMKY